MTPQNFVQYLKDQQIKRCFFVCDPSTGQVRASHPQLRPIADFLSQEKRDFDRHEGIFLQVTDQHDTLQGAFVHSTVRGQAAGGTRFWSYDSLEDYLRDGLRLSHGMTRKNALAGLWIGGGKGVMARNPEVDIRDPQVRSQLFNEYGELVTSIRGCYLTAEDVGTDTTDIGHIFQTTRFVITIPEKVGGSGNPSAPTALGVVCGMEAAVAFKEGGLDGSLQGKTVAVQGLGHVGLPLVRYLFERNVKSVTACDMDADVVETCRKEFADYPFQAKVVQREDESILFEDVDILVPCATGGILNERTIPQIKAPIVCGAANNQLEDPVRDDRLLMERGITYIPDYLVNRMGIVNCAHEQYGYVDEDPLFLRHLNREWEHSIYRTTLEVMQRSRDSGQPPSMVADQLADELAQQPHPIFGKRGNLIVQSIANNGWHRARFSHLSN